MQYIEVLPADPTYHGEGALTYSSETLFKPGDILTVPLRKKEVSGVVLQVVSKPNFTVKPIITPVHLPPIPSEIISLILWMKDYYPSPMGVLAQLILPKKLPTQTLETHSQAPTIEKKMPALTAEQLTALEKISSPGLHLLHGETGSGKTRVYIELAKRAVHEGRSAMILTPEIGLTSQLVKNFAEIFGERVIVIHSQLTESIRRRTWQRILETTDPLIIIGARSALFSPISKLGLIVVDESHETAYKQDQAPHYHATNVAAKLASLHKAIVVLGSATPLVADYYFAAAKKRPIVRMTETAIRLKGSKRSIEVIDLKERGHFTSSAYLSNQLIAALQQTLKGGEQSLLFLNRRGTARVVFCKRCGWQATCPHCDLPLIYHGDLHLMRCHSCEFKSPSPVGCPDCRNVDVVFKTVGTKAIVEEVHRLFPGASVMRFDTDNKKEERVEHNYDALKDGTIDILVGTQTLAKGLDLPNLGLVGIILADSSLSFPDFTAQERTYQLLAQVIGRVGRGHRNGHVVIQTYNPESALLQSVKNGEWNTFYNKELEERRVFTFPPFCYLLKLTCKRATSKAAELAAQKLVMSLRKSDFKIAIEGPSPSFHQKSQNKFAWQIVIKANERSLLIRIISKLPSGWSYEIDPMNLL